MEEAIEISEDLVKAAKELTGANDASAAVEQILRRVIAGRRTHRSLLDLAGKIQFYEGFDPRDYRS